jgi:hypothetical protein
MDGDPSLRWSEGLALRLDWAADKPWLVIEPRTIGDGVDAVFRLGSDTAFSWRAQA